MNHEHEPHAQPEQGDDSRMARDLVDMINGAPTPEAGLRLAALVNEHGPAAIAFAQLPDTDLADPQLRQRFAEAYYRSYPDRDSLIAGELDDIGWRTEVNRLIDRLGIPDGILVWDQRAVWGALNEMYDIVDLGGQLHVFWC